MTAENLQNVLVHPYQIAESELESLEELVTQFPYFQLGHLLIAKYAHDQESMLAPQKTRRAAVYAYERRQLRRLILLLPATQEDDRKTPTTNLGRELKNSKSFFELLPAIELDEAAHAYKPTEEKQEEVVAEPKTNMKTLLKEPIETIWENQLSESDAIALFNEGRITEAAQMYETLAKQNPNQATEYQQKWASLVSNIENEKPEQEITQTVIVQEETKEVENIEAFFEHIVPDGQPDYLHFNEGLALGLYYDNKVPEAIDMYKKLMEIYPERREYYQEQVMMLVGKKIYNASFEQINKTSPKEIVLEIQPEAQIVVEPETETQVVIEPETETQVVIEPETETQVVVEPETERQQSIQDFFEDIEIEPISQISRNLAINTNAYLTNEEKPFFDDIEDFAIAPIEKIETPQPDATTIDAEVVFLTESQAISLFNQGKMQDAIAIYDQLIKQNPPKTSYYQSQIRVLRETIQEALRPAKKSVMENKPAENEEPSEDLAIRYFTMERTAEAIAIYEQLMEKHPEKRKHYLRQIDVLKS